MDISREFFKLMKIEGHLTPIYVYPAQQIIDDPDRGTTTPAFLNPIIVQGVVKTMSPESLKWKFYGTMPTGSVSVLVEKRYINLFKIAAKIKIGDNYFKVFQDDAKGFGIIEREEYAVVILSIKSVNIND